MPDDVAQTPAALPVPAPSSRRKGGETEASSERTRLAFCWYRIVQWFFSTLLVAIGGLRVTGRRNVPPTGAAILVSNHLSHLDVLVLAILLDRPLNFVARSTLFFFPLGTFIRSLGAFPIQRDGIGAQGMKETLRRLKRGGIVTLFPEGTRTRDGELGALKSGIALLATRAGVPILPVAIAGTFEAWPRSRPLPTLHPIHVHYGQVIPPEQAKALSAEDLTALIRVRILECQAIAREGLARLSAVENEAD
jgi:1-acyl-sn-glycerol-3-phosphate acyltransferase